jgi:hypothetical protein
LSLDPATGMSGADGDGFVPVKSADRVLAILELLAARHRRYSLSEISQELGIPVTGPTLQASKAALRHQYRITGSMLQVQR